MQLSATDMVISLIKGGMSESEIALRVGITQPTVHRIKTGSGTSYEKGKKIEALYNEAFDICSSTKSGKRASA
jgi:predicted transcriptional regulator